MKNVHVILLFSFWTSHICYGQLAVDNAMHHLRNAHAREWSEFPTEANKNELSILFTSKSNSNEHTLSLRQYDVKQNWRILLNEHDMGALATDEKEMRTYFSIPAGSLRDGQNKLVIRCKDDTSDDIRVGEIKIDNRPLDASLSDATIELQVIESTTNRNLPARITIINKDGILQTVTSSAKKNLAIRPGVVYTATGKASINLPAGSYTIYAGRGFEYGVDSAKVVLKSGDKIQKTLRIKREVSTEGWISSDTHIHTFTHSRHGDATIEERAITIAGEGIELPIMTDHNIYVDITPVAKSISVLNYFTPVVGDELTTKYGHFNIFKTNPGTQVIDPNVNNWNDVIRNIHDTDGAQAVILNHARDIHHGFRPFGPNRHLSSSGTANDDWNFPANAMEVINSGSQQTNIMNLYHDWFGMLNRGYYLTPAGSSDSHDVARYIVGQGRTYIQGNDTDVGNLDVDTAIRNFFAGKVMVSLGLVTKILVNNQYGPGELVPGADILTVAVEVHGPAWAKAERVSLYANGKKIREANIQETSAAGVKWKGGWDFPMPSHDLFLVAIAEGPGSGMPYWPIAKPYQPASLAWTPRLLGSTGAVWIDADKSGKRDAAYHYAKSIMDSSGGDIKNILTQLKDYDEAVAVQVAVLLWREGRLNSPEVLEHLPHASKETRAGFERTINEIDLLADR